MMTVLLALVATAAASGAAAARLPAIEGWTMGADVRTFGPATLYQQIDGASELYLSYGFVELAVAEYTNGDGASVTVEVYRHASPVHAFGIYSQERPAEGRYFDVGAEGYFEEPAFNVLAGDAYVKLSAQGLGTGMEATLVRFAERIAAQTGTSRLPAALAFFPEEGKQPKSERFSARDFLGYEFLRAGFTADYGVGGVRFQLFVIEAQTAEESREMLRRYRARAGAPEAGEGASELIRDPYNGEVALFRKGRYICGALRLSDAALRERFLGALRGAVAAAD